MLVKTISDSFQHASLVFVGADQNDNGMRIGIYNLKEQYIKKGSFIIIKEPFYKIANDLVPVIRVDNPKDCIFNAE